MVPSTRHAYGYRVTRVSEAVPTVNCDQPEIAVQYWHDVIEKQPWYDPDKEHLVALLMNTRSDIKGWSMVSIGSGSECIAHPREIFRAAVAAAAYGIVLMHNHPSGDPSPSPADLMLTRRIKDSADILQIKFFDHVIVGKPWPDGPAPRVRGLFSFKESGAI